MCSTLASTQALTLLGGMSHLKRLARPASKHPLSVLGALEMRHLTEHSLRQLLVERHTALPR